MDFGGFFNFRTDLICVQDEHKYTKMLSYRNSYNDQSAAFSTDIMFSLRVEMQLFNALVPKSNDSVYTHDNGAYRMLSSTPYNNYRLNVGGTKGIPDWLASIVNQALCCDEVFIDTKQYSKVEGATFEAINGDNYNLRSWNIEIGKTNNSLVYEDAAVGYVCTYTTPICQKTQYDTNTGDAFHTVLKIDIIRGNEVQTVEESILNEFVIEGTWTLTILAITAANFAALTFDSAMIRYNSFKKYIEQKYNGLNLSETLTNAPINDNTTLCPIFKPENVITFKVTGGSSTQFNFIAESTYNVTSLIYVFIKVEVSSDGGSTWTEMLSTDNTPLSELPIVFLNGSKQGDFTANLGAYFAPNLSGIYRVSVKNIVPPSDSTFDYEAGSPLIVE
jgi:hypothetical protein